ncbi:hypothetical protein CLOM_g1028 [Closterium sp. NIES-68]|nr:hypothetical protein CLOM_g1028 [Closterium sp. NIES-68]
MFQLAGFVGGDAIADWETEGGEGREGEWDEEGEDCRGERSEDWGAAEERVDEEEAQEQEEQEEEEEEFDVERMVGEEWNRGVDSVAGKEGGFERGSGEVETGCGEAREGHEREEE